MKDKKSLRLALAKKGQVVSFSEYEKKKSDKNLSDLMSSNKIEEAKNEDSSSSSSLNMDHKKPNLDFIKEEQS